MSSLVKSAVGKDVITGTSGSTVRSSERVGLRPLSTKIQQTHLERLAIVYVRQSTPHQVLENHESRSRQYALVDCAAALGWSCDRTVTIDEDQGRSGQSAEGRTGFQRLLLEVTLDHVGLILGLEMSRLARSNKDWHHLLELCALFGTLLADQEGVYDPRDPNDRLLLGMKGTMSELEIHTMRNRLNKGKLHKAQRGELFGGAPIGFVKTSSGGLEFDPDEQARAVVSLIFDKFDELGTVSAVFRYLLQNGIRIGVRAISGPGQGQLEWRQPCLVTLYGILHHPFYCGTYAYGRRTVDPKRKHEGRYGTRLVPMDQWKVVLEGHLPAYITRGRYVRNQERLQKNRSLPNSTGTPRKGVALLSGVVYCGHCGTRLRVNYSRTTQARYACLRNWSRGLKQCCSSVAAASIDGMVTQQILRALEPAALDLSLRASDDVQRERDRLTLHWKQQLERAGYESSRAERHYRAVEPENRLVARTLEQQWERALRNEQQLQEDYDRFLTQTPEQLTSSEKEKILALATDIPALWRVPSTTIADRKELVRCILERVEISVQGRTEFVDVTLQWAGGFVSQHQVVRPVRDYAQLRESDRLVERLRQLWKTGHSGAQIAERLNAEGFHPVGRRSRFNGHLIRQLLQRWNVSTVPDGELVLGPDEWKLIELANRLQIHRSKMQRWARRGWLHSRRPRAFWSYIIWADQEELARLAQLRDYTKAHPRGPIPAELARPENRRS